MTKVTELVRPRFDQLLYLEGANSEVDQLLLTLQLQLELPNKLAAVKKMRIKMEIRKKKKRFSSTWRREQAHPWLPRAGW